MTDEQWRIFAILVLKSLRSLLPSRASRLDLMEFIRELNEVDMGVDESDGPIFSMRDPGDENFFFKYQFIDFETIDTDVMRIKAKWLNPPEVE